MKVIAMDIRSQLRGAWRVYRVTIKGVEKTTEEGDEHFLWFTEDTIVTGNADAAWDMPFVVVADGCTAKIDITRNDDWDPWIDEAFVRVEGDELELCSSGAADAPRPDGFGSSAANGWTLYQATRCDEPLPTSAIAAKLRGGCVQHCR